ncbi:MAG TPA: manganese efflux pump MntP family protein [Rectinemataceae bacterium]|nr:manganese efflux pump MntP family protein [Rectinemataceae bacterium]
MLTYILVALGLSMDAFAVSVSSGICYPRLRLFDALRASLFFGMFQFAMPIAGWLLSGVFRAKVENYSSWIAFGLLAFVGGKMIVESFSAGKPPACDDDDKPRKGILALHSLLALSVATSLDAFAVGIGYGILRVAIIVPATITGLITFSLSMIGTEFGKRLGAVFERWAELAGGVILIGIGANLILQHLLR